MMASSLSYNLGRRYTLWEMKDPAYLGPNMNLHYIRRKPWKPLNMNWKLKLLADWPLLRFECGNRYSKLFDYGIPLWPVASFYCVEQYSCLTPQKSAQPQQSPFEQPVWRPLDIPQMLGIIKCKNMIILSDCVDPSPNIYCTSCKKL